MASDRPYHSWTYLTRGIPRTHEFVLNDTELRISVFSRNWDEQNYYSDAKATQSLKFSCWNGNKSYTGVYTINRFEKQASSVILICDKVSGVFTNGTEESATNSLTPNDSYFVNLEFLANGGAIQPHSLTEHTDVTITAPSNGEILTYNGAEWVNSTASEQILGRTGIVYNFDNTPNGTPPNPGGWTLETGNLSTSSYFKIDNFDVNNMFVQGMWSAGVHFKAGDYIFVVEDLNRGNHGRLKIDSVALPQVFYSDYTGGISTPNNDADYVFYHSPSRSAGAEQLNDLSDVTITKVADQQILVYQQGTGQWQNQALPPTSETGNTVSAVFFPGNLPANNEIDLNFATGLFRINQNNLFGTPQTFRQPSLGDLIHLTQQNGQGEMVVLRVTSEPTLIGQYWEMDTNILKNDVFSSLVDNYTLLIVKEAVDQYIETTDPLVTSDKSGGYVVGDQWVNNTTGDIFICVDNTVGAAVWKDISFDNSKSNNRVGHPYNFTNVVPGGTIELPKGTVNLDDDMLYISTVDANDVDISQVLLFIGSVNQTILQWFLNSDSGKYFYVKIEPSDLLLQTGTSEPDWYEGTVTVAEVQGSPTLGDEGTLLLQPVHHTELGQVGDVTLGNAFPPTDGDQLTYSGGVWTNLTNILGNMEFTGTNTTIIGAVNSWTKIAGNYTLGSNSFQIQLGTGAPAPLNSLQSVDNFNWQVEVKYFATLSSGSANQDISLSVYKNGSILNESILEASLVTTNRAQTVTGIVWTDVTLNDYFELFVRNVSGANDVDVTNSHLFIHAIRLL